MGSHLINLATALIDSQHCQSKPKSPDVTVQASSSKYINLIKVAAAMSDEKATVETVDPAVPHHSEKQHQAKGDLLHEFHEREGYVLDAETGAAGAGVKVAKDGRTRLIPQPSDDPDDPLNWSWRKKHTVLFVISLASFLPDYGSATGAVTLIPQAAQWGMTPDEVNHSQAGNVFMLGVGGIFGRSQATTVWKALAWGC